MRRFLLIALIVAAAIAYRLSLRPPASSLAIGQPPPAFALPDSQGVAHSLQEFSGGPVLINFWASWCHTCVEEIPSLNRLADHYAGGAFRIVSISEDGPTPKAWDDIANFQQRLPLHYQILLDADGAVANRYGTYMLPESYLLDRHGRLVRKIVGAIVWDHPNVLAEIDQLIEAKP